LALRSALADLGHGYCGVYEPEAKGMGRKLLFFLLVMACASFPAGALGQYVGEAVSDGPSFWAPSQFLGSFSLSGIVPGRFALTAPKVYVGYQGLTDGWKSGRTRTGGPFHPS
jgi:hypothetical protein